MDGWRRYARVAMVVCLIVLVCAAVCAVADSSAMTSTPREKNRRRTGMSGKGVWFSVISFVTSIGWIATSEQETVRSSGLWVLAGRSANTVKAQKEAAKGAVVHIVDQAKSKEIVGDALLGVKTPTPALIFRRVVEQYLWHEKTKGRKHKMQIHTYHKAWSSHFIDSSKFVDNGPHVNPPNPALRTSTIVAKESTVSDFKLPSDLLRQLDNWERLNVNPDEVKLVDNIHYSVQGKMTGWLYLRPNDLNLVKGVSSTKGKGILKRTVYLSGSTLDEPGKSNDSGDGAKTQDKIGDKDEAPAKGTEPPWKQPEVGDLRVRWEMITPQVVSILGMHGGDGVLEPWLGPGNPKVTPEQALESVFLLRSGSLGISDLVSRVINRNAGEAWEQRMFGFGTMTMGSFLFCHFMEYTTDYADLVAHIPIIGVHLANLEPNTQRFQNAMAIPVCTIVLTVVLALVMNLFWRAFYMVRGK